MSNWNEVVIWRFGGFPAAMIAEIDQGLEYAAGPRHTKPEVQIGDDCDTFLYCEANHLDHEQFVAWLRCRVNWGVDEWHDGNVVAWLKDENDEQPTQFQIRGVKPTHPEWDSWERDDAKPTPIPVTWWEWGVEGTEQVEDNGWRGYPAFQPPKPVA